jgi:hypothetical protein
MSRGFIATLAGVGVTLLAWYGPWEWPGWPAFTAISLVFGNAFSELPFAARAASIVGLLVINIGFWVLIAYGAAAGVARFAGSNDLETRRP